jgi:hypothetical protein
VEISSPQIRSPCVVFKQQPKVNNHSRREKSPNQGPMLWFLKIFSQKNFANKLAFFCTKQC